MGSSKIIIYIADVTKLIWENRIHYEVPWDVIYIPHGSNCKSLTASVVMSYPVSSLVWYKLWPLGLHNVQFIYSG